MCKRTLASSDSFGVEAGKAEKAIEWLNSYAAKNNHNFQAKLEGYQLQTIKFGTFEVISWKGDWSAARSIIRKSSSKLNIKVMEGGYHEKKSLLSAMLGGSEYAKVYGGGNLIGQVQLASKSGKWIAKFEKNG